MALVLIYWVFQREIAKQTRYVIVYGTSAKHSRGQKVGLEHILEDEDVVQIGVFT